MDRPRPWLKYVDAEDLEDMAIDFGDLHVENAAGDDLGDVDGFVVDSSSGHPRYVVVDSGGWFKSKHYLLPVAHARLDASRHVLVADLTRDRITRFPGFHKDLFEKLTDEELERLDADTAAICCPTDVTATSRSMRTSSDRWLHDQKPDWWDSNPYRPDRGGEEAVTAGSKMNR